MTSKLKAEDSRPVYEPNSHEVEVSSPPRNAAAIKKANVI
jgi:hypothetical protein